MSRGARSMAAPTGSRFFVRRLAGEALARLKPGGRLMLELGDGQAEAARERFAADGWGR